MLNYNKNKLINKCLVKYYETFAHTLDTSDYVPEKFTLKILKYIFKNMRRQFRKIDKDDKQYQRQVNKKAKDKAREQAELERKQAKLQAPLIRFRAKQEKAEQRRQVKEIGRAHV